jgi:outer membrane protein insertion porin family
MIMKARTAFVLLALLLCSSLLAAAEDNIAKIEIIGNERIDRGVIANVIKTKEKEPYDPDKVREDMKNVYKVGFFSDVQIDVKDSPQGKVVTFVVVERPPVSAIFISGNKKLKTDEIKDKLKIKTNTVLNTEKVKESIDEVRKLYATKGYYATKVNYDIDYEEGYRAQVRFTIEEPERAFIRKIAFTGNKHFKDGSLKGVMRTAEKGWFSWFTGSGVLDEENLDEDRKQVEAFYSDNGYVRARVGTPDVKISPDGKAINISIPIEEGNVYKVGTLGFKGDLIFDEKELAPKLVSKTGNTFRSSLFRQDILTLTDVYQDQGFAFAEISPLTNVEDETQTVNITFDINKGQEVFFNRINIIGNVKTRDKVVRRELRFVEGDRFSATKLKDSKTRLKNTTFFKEVDTKIQKTDQPDLVNLDVVVEEKPTGTLSLGIGYSTEEKVMLTGAVSQDNFLGTGRRLSLEGAIGAISRDFSFSYLEPYIFDTEFSTGLSLYNTQRDFDAYDYRSQGGSVTLMRAITEYVKAGIRYKYEKTRVFNVSDDAGFFIREQQGTARTSSVTLSLGRNSIDDVLNPTKGDIGDISVEYAGGPFGGDNYFYKTIGTYGRYFPFYWDTAFYVKGTAGMVEGYSGKQVPIYERFFVGGINSVRGFKYGEAGPLDPVTGDPIGGTKQLFFNFEWIFPIFKPAGIRGVVFFDVGHGFDDSSGFLLDGARTSAGFGIRWLSPVGPLRIELGFNLNPKKNERRSVFDFTMGRAF